MLYKCFYYYYELLPGKTPSCYTYNTVNFYCTKILRKFELSGAPKQNRLAVLYSFGILIRQLEDVYAGAGGYASLKR